MNESGLDFLTLGAAAAALKSKELSPVDLTKFSLEKIESLNPRLNAFLTVLADEALQRAKRAEDEIQRGDYLGPMHGIPYAVKDIYATEGIRTTNGASVFSGNVPNSNSTAVDNLSAAGGVLIGKNHCLEFACGSHNPLYGEVHNPWNLDHTPGGSSSGSASSVAAGLVFGSMGSCTGGSIRGPASFCSIVGLKPTYGLVSRHGVFPLSWSLDHAGPMTRTVEDCAIMLQAVAGYDQKDPSSANVKLPDYVGALGGGIKGLRVGVPKEFIEGSDEEVTSLVEEAIKVLAQLGARIVDVQLPITGEYAAVSGNVITWSEAAQVHAPWIERLEEYTKGVQQKVLVGSVISSTMYHKAQQLRRLVQDEIADAMKEVDVLVGAPVGAPPGKIQTSVAAGGDAAAYKMATQRSFSRPQNLTGQPAVSVPCGFSKEGLPVGFQISGRLFEDDVVLKVAHAYEQATEWHKMHPEL
jgi:aspartyl-tRNA(Asn)/glutamyl-tRNA(Gln) amidotransferase subunit A